MNQYIVSYKITDAVMVSATSDEYARIAGIEEAIMAYDADEEDIEITSVKLI